ncbi:Axonemal dynein ligt chain [Spironucleus salmonicida]|uniref:Axonemal dynein ligt chain n=1 Tax=Spironucleus salmonicida TaxID=348837 RepID=V6LHD5_9EUKA|nr:Axonemal dynein ligt chain [Spironucleus salmonicida]|eukprot:EST43975.1 Axonemal dynein ligt chain [Spironucleus salmonicida]
MSQPVKESLIKYDPPLQAAAAKEKQKKARAVQAAGQGKNSTAAAEDILNSLLLPRAFEQDGEQWVQFVSSQPATRLDVLNLQEKLDQQLKVRQAREMGLCPIREDIYAQCFDELIRQVAVNCIERGVLLTRVRDEMRMTIAAYQTLYESAVAFGIRKTLLAEQGKTEMTTRIKELEEENERIKRQLAEHKARLDAAERTEAERRALDEKRHAEEVVFLKKQVIQLKSQLENILSV